MDGNAKFILIAVTRPDSVENEASKITRLLENGIDFVHIRKPESTLREVKNLIEDIPYKLRCRLKLHGHFELLNEFNLGGAHINSRCPVAPASAANISRSCHSLEEVNNCLNSGMQYVTLSPIYDSISKEGYLSAFKPDDLRGKIDGKNVIALGGVTPNKFPELRKLGFAGAAMLGCVWSDTDTFLRNLNNTK